MLVLGVRVFRGGLVF